MLSSLFLVLLPIFDFSNGCRPGPCYFEPENFWCTDPDGAVFGSIQGTSCDGQLGCRGPTEPCLGECREDNPVLSEDGKSCSKCEGDFCSPCSKTEQFWCGASQTCLNKRQSCGGKCPNLRYPVIAPKGQCNPCPDGQTWCPQASECVDRSGPCNGRCVGLGKRFCNETNSCIDNTAACGNPSLNSVYTQACIGVQNRRLCYKSTGTTCVSNDQPCLATCPPNLHFCLQTYSCLSSPESCPCPADKWGCSILNDTMGEQQECNLQDTDTNPVDRCRMVKDADVYSVRYLDAEECHPNYYKDKSGQSKVV